ncbi:hypothetical protein ABT026_04285 [Streptomyces sp. NPDC002734]|uniref:hypothetical protein n=1 Tax=Streptomyces sp. NPDC002734 TaxID=3154426 RepID=UPI00332EFE20
MTLVHVAALSGPYVVAVCVAALLFVALRRLPERPGDGRREPPTWRKALLLGVSLGATTYLLGLMTGSSLQPEESCANASGRAPGTALEAVDRSYLPLSHTCRWADGAVHEMVPGWVNPALLAWATLTVLCLSVPLRDLKPRNAHPSE